MNFCVANLILKMEENTHNVFSINAKKDLGNVYREGTVTEWLCSGLQKWFAKFCAGDLLLDDAPWLSRPDEIGSNQIKTLLANYQHFIWERANILKISKSIKLLVNMKNVFYFTEKAVWTFWPTNISTVKSKTRLPLLQLFLNSGCLRSDLELLRNTENIRVTYLVIFWKLSYSLHIAFVCNDYKRLEWEER